MRLLACEESVHSVDRPPQNLVPSRYPPAVALPAGPQRWPPSTSSPPSLPPWLAHILLQLASSASSRSWSCMPSCQIAAAAPGGAVSAGHSSRGRPQVRRPRSRSQRAGCGTLPVGACLAGCCNVPQGSCRSAPGCAAVSAPWRCMWTALGTLGLLLPLAGGLGVHRAGPRRHIHSHTLPPLTTRPAAHGRAHHPCRRHPVHIPS